ncbi:MAG TPA: transglycosylase SLT domain-containing protein [Blastocatellia bacterium]
MIFFLLAGAVIPVYGQGQPRTAASSDMAQSVIDRAEEAFKRGEEAQQKGLPDIARRFFDQAVDTVLNSGVDLRTNAKLDSYYRQLLERIHKYEAQPGDRHELEDRPEVVEPSLLDELSDLKDTDLAMTTPDGIKIFGKYDFEFAVAPPVFQFVNFFVAGRGHSTMEVGLQRSGRYRQLAEKIFKEERVPQDLIWLAQAESVWKPNALSRAAAKGIWQFIPSTGSRYGLAQTAWIDERSQPEKATRAAARYLRWLHDHFAGDWLLAMAAYNSGENRVDSAVARCGYADFWELYKRNLLPQETRNYVPIILAITIISKNQKRYGFNVQPDPPMNYDTFELPAQTDMKVVADLVGVPYDSIQNLNPELRRGVSPPGQGYTLRLPKGIRKQFEVAYAELPEDQRVRKIQVPAEEMAERYRPVYKTQVASYTVRRGDTMQSVARRYGVSVKEIARMNRMSARGELRKGQTVRIPQTVKVTRDRHGRKIAVRATRDRHGRMHEVRASRSRRGGRHSAARGRSSSHSRRGHRRR